MTRDSSREILSNSFYNCDKLKVKFKEQFSILLEYSFVSLNSAS